MKNLQLGLVASIGLALTSVGNTAVKNVAALIEKAATAAE
jgi:hypothetical protein